MTAFWEDRRLLPVALSLPVVVLLGWTLSLHFRNRSAQTFVVAVEGFDPRDLLSGHYLRYQLSLASPCPETLSQKGSACACFAQTGITIAACPEAATQCSAYVPGACHSGRFRTPVLEKYFFPETLTAQLFTVPPGATATLKVGRGWAEATGMMVNGESIEDWAARQQREKNGAP